MTSLAAGRINRGRTAEPVSYVPDQFQPELDDPNRGYAASWVVLTALFLTAISGNGPFAVWVLVAGLLALAWANTFALLVMAFPIYALGGALASGLMIENGAWIGEQGRAGMQSGSTALLAAYTFAFLFAGHWSIRLAVRSVRRQASWRNPENATKLLTLGLLGLAAFQFGIVALYGTAISFGEARFAYWDRLPPQIETLVKLTRPLGAPAAVMTGYFAMRVPHRPKRFFLLLILTQIPLFLMGDKLSPFIGVAAHVIVGVALWHLAVGTRYRPSIKQLIWLMVGATIVGAVLVTAYGFQGVASNQVVQTVTDRTVLQGHVWYGIHDHLQRGGDSLTVADLIRPNVYPTSLTGLDQMSLLVANDNFVMSRLARGITFTLGGPAAPYVVFGPWLGMGVYALLALLLGATTRFVLGALMQARLAFAFVGATFFVSVYAITIMGNWYSIYNSASILFFIMVVLWLFAVTPSQNNPARAAGRPGPRPRISTPPLGTAAASPDQDEPPGPTEVPTRGGTWAKAGTQPALRPGSRRSAALTPDGSRALRPGTRRLQPQQGRVGRDQRRQNRRGLGGA